MMRFGDKQVTKGSSWKRNKGFVMKTSQKNNETLCDVVGI